MIKKQSSLDMLSKELEIWENKVKWLLFSIAPFTC
jgi:hypothetical protein